MAETPQINVQVDQKTLGIVLDAFRSMRDTPGAIDYQRPITSPPERLANLISKLEKYEALEDEPLMIPMTEQECGEYVDFVYCATICEDLDPKVSDFLDELYDQYSDWEDNGFKPEGSDNEPT